MYIHGIVIIPRFFNKDLHVFDIIMLLKKCVVVKVQSISFHIIF